MMIASILRNKSIAFLYVAQSQTSLSFRGRLDTHILSIQEIIDKKLWIMHVT